MKTAIVVARMQTDVLHDGYLRTFKEIETEGYKQLILVLGESVTRLTNTKPIPFIFRKQLVDLTLQQENYNFSYNILKLDDYQSDEVWSEKLDDIVNAFVLEDFNFITGRDSFEKYYTGKYKDKFKTLVDSIDATCSSMRRKQIMNNPELTKFKSLRDAQIFCRALIFASQYKYPTIYSTVDMVVYSSDRRWILLGKKYNENFWRLPGGFVDTTDKNKESSAYRELFEETGLGRDCFISYETKFIYDKIIDDWRYSGSKDKIMTNLYEFVINYDYTDSAKAGDDLEEIKWFRIKELKSEKIFHPHKIMLIETGILK